MLKKSVVIPWLLGALLTSSALAQVGVDPAAIEAAKRAAAQASGSLSSQAFVYDQSGNVERNPDGTPKTTKPGTASLEGGLRSFQAITGTESVGSLTSPGLSGRTGAATVSLSQSAEFRCVPNLVPRVIGLGGAAARVDGCTFDASGRATSVATAFCFEGLRAGTCTSDRFDSAQQLPVGSFVSVGSGLSAGVGCNSLNQCQLTIEGDFRFGGNGTNLANQGATAAAASSLAQGLRDTVTQQDYAGKMMEIGQPLVAAASATPVVSRERNNSCTSAPTCISEALTVNTYERSCVRTFPLTNRVSTQTFDKTATCTVERVTRPEHGENSNSCSTETLADMTKVGETGEICARTAPVPGQPPSSNPEMECAAYQKTEYWVNIGAPVLSGVSATPSPVGGACAPLLGSTSSTECSGSWFGRTLADNQCLGQYVDEATGGVTGNLNFNFFDIPGCGFCLQQSVAQTCYADVSPQAVDDDSLADVQDSCAHIDLNECSLVSAAPEQIIDGLVLSQRETFSCRKETRQCVQWSAAGSDPSCFNTDITHGLDKVQQTNAMADGSLNAALIAAAQVDGTARGVEGTQNPNYPKLFGGEDLRCNRPAGGIGALLNKNCCRTNLERPKKGNIIQGGCSMNEARLAAARRSNYAKYIGEYCSRRFLGKCLRRTQTYCVFQGILPRIVQEQGRAQLSRMTASSSNAQIQRGPLNYAYYDSGNGRWTDLVTYNGVRVAAWQWPSYCADPQKAHQTLMENAEANVCASNLTTWFAACDSGNCGPLPSSPEEGAVGWDVAPVDPLQNVTTAISRLSVVNGACSPSSGQCSYTVSAWPVGVGGRAVATKEISWDLFGQEMPVGEGVSARAFTDNNMGDFIFRGLSVAGGGSLPASVPVDFSRDGGQSWTRVNLLTNAPSQEQAFPGSDVTAVGSCSVATNSCEFRMTGTVSVSAKPWGGPHGPDCSGFTPGQIAVLDFSAMDLSEWLATVLDKVGGQNVAELTAQAQSQVQNFNALFQQGQVKASAPTAANFARVVPAEGFGPFNVRLVVSGYWPEVTGDPSRDIDRVLSVTVNWGDCSPAEQLMPVPANEGTGFRGTHTYQGPNADSHACLKKTPGDTLNRNVTHEITLTVQTSRSGTQVRKLAVENAWSVFPGGNSNNDIVRPATSVTPAGQSAPQAPLQGLMN